MKTGSFFFFCHEPRGEKKIYKETKEKCRRMGGFFASEEKVFSLKITPSLEGRKGKNERTSVEDKDKKTLTKNVESFVP